MTRKKTKLTRDKDKTIKGIFACVGKIMRTVGHTGLNEVQITNCSGNARSIINYYFDGMPNLKKAYINQQDYWTAFFERFQLADNPEKEDVRQLFIEIMQENFRYFEGDPEMQKIILWQISEESSLMRSVSEAREVEGDKILIKADKYFKDTGVNIKAVMALLLGGIYYMVLHSQTNKSRVAGIDINEQTDRKQVLITIKQIIEWAWDKTDEDYADKTIHTNNPTLMINNATDGIETIAAEIASQSKRTPLSDIPTTSLILECRRLKPVIETHLLNLTNPTQVNSFQSMMLQKLVTVCDNLFQVYKKVSPDTMVVLNFIENIRNIIPQKVNPKISLPLAFLIIQKPILMEKWQSLQEVLKANNIDELLIEIIGLPVTTFDSEERRLTWGDYTWLRRYFTLLEDVDWENPSCATQLEGLISQMIRMDYNHQRFFAYCYKVIKQKVYTHISKKQKLNELIRCRTLVMQDSQLAEHRYEPRFEKINIQLCNWIEAEIEYVTETEPEDVAEIVANPFKLMHRMNIFCIAVWYKMIYDLDFYDESSLDILAEKLVYNSATKRMTDLSANSMSGKFFTKDERIIRQVRKFVVRMLEYLDNLLAQLR